MVDTIWDDVSEWQCPVDDTYPYPVLAVRSDDGTYQDVRFTTNYKWACQALDDGRLHVLIIYLVYRPNWADELATIKTMVGIPHHHTVVMIDVESWSGQITGDNSGTINDLYWGLADWLGDHRRVIAYGNTSDLDTLWPTKPPGLRLIIAAYGSNPDYPGKLGHQFTDGVTGGPLAVSPFGFADVNSADGYDITAFCAALGLGASLLEEQVPWKLERTPSPPNTPSGATPTGAWPAIEDTITFPADMSTPTARMTFGFNGAWVQEAWWGPTGTHVVSPPTGLRVSQFAPLNWSGPPSSTFLVLRYAAPGGGSVGISAT